MDTTAELADLRARAYAPDAAGLTAQELARLEELETARRAAAVPTAPPVPPAPPAPPASAAPPVLPAPRAPTVTVIETAPAEPAAQPEPNPATARAVERARRPLLLAVIALAAAIPLVGIGGFFAGALVAGPTGGASPAARSEPITVGSFTDAEMQASHDEALEALEWDDDSVELLGGAGQHLVWWGTTDGGDMTCIVVDGTFLDGANVCDATDTARTSGMGLGGEFLLAEGADSLAEGSSDVTPMVVVSIRAYPYAGLLMTEGLSDAIAAG